MPKDSGMKRATCIFIVGLVALFVLQSVWIITSYNAETRKITDSIDEMLTLALQREMKQQGVVLIKLQEGERVRTLFQGGRDGGKKENHR